MRGQRETRPCAECGQALTRLVSQARGKNWYCSHVCQAAHAPAPITVAKEPNSLRGVQETRPCANCGVLVTRYLSARKSARAWTCSHSCNGQINMARRRAAGTYVQPKKPRRGETTPCETCGVSVYRNKSEAAKGGGRFCSYACMGASMTKPPVIKSCARCGMELRLKPSQAARIYCSRECMGLGKTKRPLDRMHNGKPARKDRNGYVMIFEPTHPNKSLHGWQYEHRVVVEQVLGRYLTSDEVIDHINQIKDDNRPENLQVLDASTHSVKTVKDLWGGIQAERVELEEYRRRFGPLEQEE